MVVLSTTSLPMDESGLRPSQDHLNTPGPVRPTNCPARVSDTWWGCAHGMAEHQDRTVVACVLAGGSGTRLYPASRPSRPKPLLSFEGDRSLVEDTLARVGFADETVLLTHERLQGDMSAVTEEAEIITEPAGKDTGPALSYVTWKIRQRFGDAIVVVLPSDHHVSDPEAFSEAAETAAGAAREGSLVTLGVTPTRPATEYGYIQPVSPTKADSVAEHVPVDEFTEKPDEATARSLIDAGGLWNAGVFAWTPETFFAQTDGTALEPMVTELRAGHVDAAYDAVEPISIDHAVMEQADDIRVVPFSAEWSDLGTWDAVGRRLREDDSATQPETETVSSEPTVKTAKTAQLSLNADGNVVAAPDKHVSLVDVDDLIVAAYDDRVLVAPRDSADRLREVVARLRDQDRD